MALSKIRTIWPSTGEPPRRTAAAPHGEHNLLPQDSVVISDRTKRVNKLGEGSFARVYRGEYNGKPCAVKVFKEDVLKKELSPDPRGTSEVEMLSKVQHTNVVQMYGMWLDPHKDRAAPSIVMELCDESLNDFIRRFKGKIVPNEQKLPILQDIARGMVYLHGQNIVHGDLRSSNVLLCHSEDQTVAKIADFDMARFLDPDTQLHFTVRFTAEEYLPPEVFSHNEHKDQKKRARLTPKVDIFCFGELVLEMACGMYPTPTPKFHGHKTLTELQRREKHLVKLKQCDRECLSSIMQKCLADAPEGRPSFTEILLDVEECLHKYGERPDLEVVQNKTAECEALLAEDVKRQGDAQSLCGTQDVEKDEALKRVEGLQRQMEELQRDHESLRRTSTLALQEKEDHCQRLKTDLAATARELYSAREELSVLRQEKRSLEESLIVLSHEKKCTQEKLNISEEKTLKLQGELAENQRASEADRNELVAAKVQKLLAEKERDEQAEKCLLACQERENFRNEAEEMKKQLKALKEERSTLQHKVSVLETDNANLKERFSDTEDDKDKLQSFLADSNEWIMHHLCTPDKEGSPKQLLEKTEFHAMMELFKEYYERASKQSEQTAEENQRLLASTDRLKEKVQELTQASQALQKELYEKQQCLDEQQREIAALTEKLSSLQMGAAPVPLPSNVADVRGDEALLQQLCYMATGIKELLIGPDGGTFTLGSGDASLKVPPGVVTEETSVRYAIILHGPFVFPAGYKPGSVVVYLNMEGATLKNPPVLLYLSYWSIKEREDNQDTLKFLRACHTLEEGQQEYVFEEQEARKTDFTSHTNVGVLKIWEPKCLYCVEAKNEKVARYNAITFSQYIPSEQTQLFRIQFMCDSLEWNERMTRTLMQGNWEKTSTVVSRFQYGADHQKITASPQEMTGPGWEAVIDGAQEIMQDSFLAPSGKSNDEIEREVISGRFPPCILYKIVYSSPEEKQTRPALLKVKLNGADVSLSFGCRIKEEMYLERRPRPPQDKISTTADVIGALNHSLDVHWREFGIFLHIERDILDGIDTNNSNVRDRMLQLVETWLGYDNGTGDLPRTWETVVQAVKNTGPRQLAEQLAQQYGVKLPGQ